MTICTHYNVLFQNRLSYPSWYYFLMIISPSGYLYRKHALPMYKTSLYHSTLWDNHSVFGSCQPFVPIQCIDGPKKVGSNPQKPFPPKYGTGHGWRRSGIKPGKSWRELRVRRQPGDEGSKKEGWQWESCYVYPLNYKGQCIYEVFK